MDCSRESLQRDQENANPLRTLNRPRPFGCLLLAYPADLHFPPCLCPQGLVRWSRGSSGYVKQKHAVLGDAGFLLLRRESMPSFRGTQSILAAAAALV